MTNGNEAITFPGSLDTPITNLIDEISDFPNEVIKLFLLYSHMLPLVHVLVAAFEILSKINQMINQHSKIRVCCNSVGMCAVVDELMDQLVSFLGYAI